MAVVTTTNLLQGEHADKIADFDFMYVVVHKGKHYVGGNTSGCDFLRNEGTHIPYNFIGHLAAKSGVAVLHVMYM